MQKILLLISFFFIALKLTAGIQFGLNTSDSSKIIFEAYGKKGIKNNQGKILLAAKYEALSWEENPNAVQTTFIPYKKNGHWGLIDENLNELTEAKYTSLIPFNESTFIAAIKGKYSQTIFYGLINMKGELKLAFNYRKLIAAGDKLIAASKSKKQIYYSIIDAKGRPITSVPFYQIKYLKDDFFIMTDSLAVSSVMSGSKLTEKVVNHIDSASLFKNDLSIVYQYGKVGVLHNSGKLVLPVEFKKIARNDGKLLEVSAFKKWEVLDAKGNSKHTIYADSIFFLTSEKIILTLNGQSFLRKIVEDKTVVQPLGGLFVQSWGKYMLLKNSRGSTLVDTIFYRPVMQMGDFIEANDDFLVCKSKEFSGMAYTIMNKEAKLMKVSAFDISGSLLTVKVSGYWGIYNADLKELISPIYDIILPGNKDEYVVNFQGSAGVISGSQSWIISPNMMKIEPLGNGRYWAVNKYLEEYIIEKDTSQQADLHFLIKGEQLYETNSEGYIRLLNKQIAPLMPYTVGEFYSQYEEGFLIKNDRRFKYFDFSGNQMFNAVGYDSIGLIKAEFFPVKKEGAYGFIDHNGFLRIANRYNDVLPFSEGLSAVKINKRWGFINEEEALIIQPYYDHVDSFVSGLAKVEINGRYGLIDKLGAIVIELSYDSVFNSSEIVFLRKGGIWGYADKEGNIINYPRYESIELLNGQLLVKRYQQYELHDFEGNNLLNNRYDAIYWDIDHKCYLTNKKGSNKIVFLSDLKIGLTP